MNSLQKFQNLLRQLFQFEASDLDFGVYRILNYKRDEIERFITKDLKNKVEQTFTKYKDKRTKDINEKFKEAKQKVIESLNKDVFTPTGDVKEEFKKANVVKDYLSLKAQKEGIDEIDKIKLQVFNDLYDFFFRYYEEGDFVPKYRYSIKSHKYAIPYNGEEVKLYWANADQYYTKTGLLFQDYSFFTNFAKTYKVIFRIVSAAEELGSNKATKARFFVLDSDAPAEKQRKALIIRFQYRELTDKEVAKYDVAGGSNTNRQEKINHQSFEYLLDQIEDKTLVGFLGKEYKKDKPLLFYQLSRFTAKNTKDYFIHKNLKSFLSNQLDYFIKAEVLSTETLEKERFLDKHITRAKVVREIGGKIIDFLSQIEDFQKKLWEKKKFVLKTDYVITLDRVPKEFHQEIFKNKAQVKEWKELGMLQTQNSKLPVDTKYFNQEFKEKLLEKLTEKADLDDLLGGLLIKSENWQALNLLLAKYKEQVQTIYIDPPFNLGTNADFLYNVNYKDSTWISLLESRLELARNILNEKGSIFVRCDYNGNMLVRLLMKKIFGEGNFRNEVVVNRTSRLKNEGVRYYTSQDSLFFYSKNENVLFFQQKVEEPFEIELKISEEVERRNIGEILKNIFEDFDFRVSGNKILLRTQKWVEMHASSDKDNSPPIILFGKKFYPPKKRRWMWKDERVLKQMEENGWIRINPNNNLPELLRTWRYLGTDWLDIPGYSQTADFKTENSEILLKRVIETASNKNDLVFDFFLGSGTTTGVAQKLGRKWIGVEMGEHFYSVVLPRMKKVLAYDKSGISKEKDVKEKYNEKTAGGFFKYQVLEQYEDALDNIELKPNDQAQKLFKDDYLLKYFLDFETRGNASLLNLESLKNPFSYKIKVNLEEVGEPQEVVVDMSETFNYLLGLKVKRVKVRKNQGRKYLFILGEKERKDTAIVWRDYQDNWSKNTFKEDKKFIIEELEQWGPQIVYINGQSVLTTKLGKHTIELRYIEPEFKTLMFS